MDVQKTIAEGISTTERRNAHSAKQYKKKLLGHIETNISKKKQSVAANQGLINRYHAVKPRELTQMQVALKEARYV